MAADATGATRILTATSAKTHDPLNHYIGLISFSAIPFQMKGLHQNPSLSVYIFIRSAVFKILNFMTSSILTILVFLSALYKNIKANLKLFYDQYFIKI